MKNAVPLLTALLAVQISLAFGIKYFDTQRGTPSTEKLIKTDLSKVDKIVLEEKNASLVLQKNSDNVWVLPSKLDYPAEPESVSRLLDGLKEYTRGWPVAKTEDAAPRFRVADNNFQEKITLSAGGKEVDTYLIGSAAGFNKVHFRIARQTEINAVELPSQNASTNVDDWIDRGILHIEPDNIVSVDLPQLKLARRQKAFDLTSRDKTTTIDALTGGEVLENAGGIDVSDVLGTEIAPSYGLTSPAFSYTITKKGGGKLNFVFGKMADGNFYVIKQPTGPFYLKVDGYFVDRLKNIVPGELIAKSDQLRKMREKADKVLIERTKGMQPVVPTEIESPKK
ncbi:DUF4340 domain-containing protein [Candidatus Obscuribacterales bacterium]|nr:DUF4340 domain-containing protein [Candidatus Obscuribacterales bacterium]